MAHKIELDTSQFSIQELIADGYTTGELKKLKVTAEEMHKAGVGVADCVDGEYTIMELHGGGYTGAEMKEANIPASDIKGANYTPEEIYGHYSAQDIHGVYMADEIHGIYAAEDVYNVYTPAEIEGIYSAEEMYPELLENTRTDIDNLLTETKNSNQNTEELQLNAQNFATEIEQVEQKSQGFIEHTLAQIELAETNIESRLHSTQSLIGESEKISRNSQETAEVEVQKNIDEMSNGMQHNDSNLEQLSQAVLETKNDLNDFLEHSQETVQALNTHQEKLLSAHTEYNTVTETIKADMESRAQVLVEQFNTFDANINQKIESFIAEYDAQLEEAESSVESLITTMESASDEVISTMAGTLGESLSSISSTSSSLSTSIDFLGSAGATVQEITEGGVGDIISSIEDIVGAIEKVKPGLELAKRLLA